MGKNEYLCDMEENEIGIERHPWPAFVPDGARVLVLGTFPPKRSRWSMDFFYPNRINDFWRICGAIFFGNRDALWDASVGGFDLASIQRFLTERGIAMWDTAMAVRRLRDNASDKFLEIVEEIDLAGVLAVHPSIASVVTTGEKATGVVASQMGVSVPGIGVPVRGAVGGRELTLWRVPSSSRAYPLAFDKKVAAYREMFERLLG